MAAEQGPMSGFRDMMADQMIPRQHMIETIQGVYEKYGFTPLKTPALERYSTLVGKYGEEGNKLIYHFTDNGGREVALRYDQTVPLARVVAQYAGSLALPYKRYVVGEVWRGERPQAGRYREFTQFDADVVGTTSVLSDAEIIAMMSDSMRALDVKAVVRVNNRQILDGLVELADLSPDSSMKFIGTIDKVEKIGQTAVIDEIAQNFGVTASTIAKKYLAVRGNPLDQLSQVASLLENTDKAAAGVDNLSKVFRLLSASGYSEEQVVFDPSIARGLDYYTGIVYETQLQGAPQLGSVCSGGRYDNLIKDLGGPDLPAVGTSIGVDRLYDGLRIVGALREARTKTKVLVTNFGEEFNPHYMKVVTALRRAGVAAEIHYDPTKLGKQFRHAERLGVPYALIMGTRELEDGEVKVKDLRTGDEEAVIANEMIDTIKALIDETIVVDQNHTTL